jgi:hypothetical protein
MRKNMQNKTIKISSLAWKLMKKCKANDNELHWQTIEKVCTEYLCNHGGQS